MEQGNDLLATLLFQISSPAHVPWGDQRWQEVLHGYDVWVHMDANNPLMEQACQSMTKHAELSSNLAALSLHVTRMLQDLANDIRTLQSEPGVGRQSNSNGTNSVEQVLVADFSKRISSVAKARATSGALQLLRLLCHPVIVEASKDPDTSTNSINEVFVYHTRGDLATDQPAGIPLMHALLDLITTLGKKTVTSTTSTMESTVDVLRTPEIYDAAIFSFQLFFVLCGTQLYQPFYSSFESSSSCHYFLDELFRRTNDDNNEDEAIDSDNSQIFWSSNRSVASSSTRSIGNGSSHRSKRKNRHKQKRNQPGRRKIWTPKAILETCLEWQLHRPPAPERSISNYYYILAQLAVNANGGEKPGQDGLYENHMVIQATSSLNGTIGNTFNHITGNKSDDDARHSLGNSRTHTTRKSLIVDTTKGIITLSGSIIFLPFRLLNLLYGVFTANNKHGSRDLDQTMAMRKIITSQYSRTRDVLWLSDSLLADLGCSLILLFASNKRNGEKSNAFRMELNNLTDNRWDHENGGHTLPDLPNFVSEKEGDTSLQLQKSGMDDQKRPLSTNQQQRIMPFVTASGGESHLTLNFESLFVSFGRTLHNELGALLLYTMIQSSPSFAESLAVRSDMDNIVMPLLRTLYFAFRSKTFMAKDYGMKRRSRSTSKSASGTTVSDIRDCPFRSQSQLYVIIILLLLFSQDSSFGRDVFRRVTVITVPWYKERSLKGINLGSVIILTLLRALIFNLNRLSDVFLLNNCCAVLENLSPSVADLHEYAAMRLVSVTVLLMKKHAKLVVAALKKSKNPFPKNADAIEQDQQRAGDQNNDDDNDDESNSLTMYSGVTRTLLGIIKHGLSATNIEGNAHLIYALVYHQTDFLKLCKTKYSVEKRNSSTSKKKLYSSKQVARIISVIAKASELIQEESARSAPKVLRVIELQIDDLKAVAMTTDHEITNKSLVKRKQNKNRRSDGNVGREDEDGNGMANNIAATEEEFTFLYEEEADPEVFFVPYIWDLIVCAVTAGAMEWKKDDIKAFALLDEVDEQDLGVEQSPVDFDAPATTENFSQSADDMV
jgi:hypothetical protein